jgi:hypothetical protein
MLESKHIMAGFVDIKTAFRTRHKNLEQKQQLVLWFTYVGNILYVHDWDAYDTSMAIAVSKLDKNDKWYIFLKTSSFGEILVREAIIEKKSRPDKYLNEQYRLVGLMPPSLLK